MYKFSKSSNDKLLNVDSRLDDVVRRALTISQVDFAVIDGWRTEDEQRMMVKRGVSQTMHSKHRKDPAQAVDLVPINPDTGKGDFNDDVLWMLLKTAMFQAALDLDIKIAWGGDWRTFKDKPHFELV